MSRIQQSMCQTSTPISEQLVNGLIARRKEVLQIFGLPVYLADTIILKRLQDNRLDLVFLIDDILSQSEV